MKAAKNPSVIEKLKQEMMAQEEGQSEVLELTFDAIDIGKFTPEVSKLFQKYSKLISLEFSECGITTLEGFPKIPGLVKLSLETNQLGDDAIKYIVDNFKELQFLSLTANQIRNLESLKQLDKLPQLVQLDLQDNPVARENRYRQTLFEACKQLEILDNHDKDNNEINYSDDDDEEDDDEDDAELGDMDGDDDFDDDEDLDDEENEPAPSKKRK